MKIVATPLPTGTPITLGDDSAGDFILDPLPLPSERRQAEIEQLAMGARVFAADRGNRQTSFSWTVSRTHADLATAEGFAWTHAAAVPIGCSLVITQDAGTVTFSAAFIEAVDIVEWSGVSTKTRYSVVGASA